jgi:Spy/CpxP family protein refolding chaperone
MKKVLVFALMVMLGLGAAFAQQQRDPAQMLQRQVDRMKEALSLTDAQVAKITPILKDAQEKQAAARAKAREAGQTFDRDKFMADMKKSNEEIDAKIKSILTPDQVTKLAEMRKQQAERMANRGQ